MTKKKIVYYNMPGDVAYEKELLEEWKIDDLEIEQKEGSSVLGDLAEYEGVVTEYTFLTKEILEQLPSLQIIALQSIGYDEIDVKAARNLEIDVTNAPGFCAEDVAIHAMALLLGLVRQIPLFNEETHKGKWNPYAGRIMHRLEGKTAGLVSFGNIPQRLIPMLKGFGIQVISFDPGVSVEVMAEKGVQKCADLSELLNIADFVFLHTPLLEKTRHMMNEQTIGQMKDNAVLINVSRGGLVDENALIAALKSGKLAGAGLDVLEDEENHSSELFEFSNVIITPHAAFLSEESLKQSRKMALEQLVTRLSKNKKPALSVN